MSDAGERNDEALNGQDDPAGGPSSPAAAAAAAATATLADATADDAFDDDIFGGDSDLSDLDDSDDEGQTRKRAPRPPAGSSQEPVAAAGRVDHDDDDDDDGNEDEQQLQERDINDKSGDGDDDEYREHDIRKTKIPKRKSTREGSAPGEPRRKKKKTKEPVEEVEEEIDPEVARRRALEARIDAIVKTTKRAGGKKKKNANEDDLEQMNDEAVATLRVEMLTAADRDVEANQQGMYAVNKLRLLPRVVEMMQKTALAEPLIEAGALEAIRRWLEPLPDKSLPVVNIQRSLFEILRTFSIETSALKSSGLGKIVYFYTKCKRVEPYIARMANQLVSDWMRPIIRRSKAMADRERPDFDDENAGYGAYDYAAQQEKRAEASQGASGGAVARRHARIPNQLSATFKVAPAADPSQRAEKVGGQLASQGVAVGGTKIRSYKNKLKMGQAASRRV
ncbi:hypothetical protein ACM66B_006370 [Microbotryomycetes sp. NB124-2]